MKKKKWIWLSIVAVVVIVAVVAVMSQNGEDITEVQAELAYVDDIKEVVTASGRIQPQTKVDITAEVSAEIIEVFASEGQVVTKGTPLLVLDTVQYISSLEEARYSLDEIKAREASAKSQLERDKREYEIQKSLFDKNHGSETDFINAKFAFENSQANFDALQAQVKSARARLDKAEDNLTKTTIVAPMDGVIIYQNAEVGEIAQAQTSFTQGQTLMTIADLSVFEVEVDIDESQIAQVHLNQNTDIRIDAFRDSIFTGEVVEIGNSALVSGAGTEDYSTNFRVKIRLDNTSSVIRPGMSASVEITTATENNAVLIPYASVVVREFHPDSLDTIEELAEEEDNNPNQLAVVKMEGETDKKKGKNEKVKIDGVFVIENGIAKFKKIKTGIANEQYIVAEYGVTPGDTIISGSFKTLRQLEFDQAVAIDQFSQDKMKEED